MYMGNQTLQTWQSDRREPCRAYLSPLLLWSEEKLCSWAISPCLRNTQQRCAWRELAKGNNISIDIFHITLI